MTGYLCAFLGLSKSWGSCQCTGGFAEQVMSWILALAPQGPATGFLKFCFLELFISCVLPWEKCHCCHTNLGTHSLAGTPQLWEVGSGGSLAVLPSRDEGIGGCTPLLPPPPPPAVSGFDFILPACFPGGQAASWQRDISLGSPCLVSYSSGSNEPKLRV